jgi:hypothetical protein
MGRLSENYGLSKCEWLEHFLADPEEVSRVQIHFDSSSERINPKVFEQCFRR